LLRAVTIWLSKQNGCQKEIMEEKSTYSIPLKAKETTIYAIS
jgi:hypothetical protein